MSDPDFTAIFNQVHGFLSLAEAELLYRLTSEVPANGVIVEIGSYQGRSTVCLGLGAKEHGAWVYAVDPHYDYEVDGTHYSMADNQYYYANLAKFGVGDVVRTLNTTSFHAVCNWKVDHDWISLLWIDGSHEYEYVSEDFRLWSQYIHGKIVMHDTAGYHPGVTQMLNEILAAGQWTITQRVDAIAVLSRI